MFSVLFISSVLKAVPELTPLDYPQNITHWQNKNKTPIFKLSATIVVQRAENAIEF